MFYTPPAGTHFYRVTARGRSWSDVLSGSGSYFSAGGRYNRVQQRTVYAAADPLVSIAEYVFHVAVDLHCLLGRGPLNAPALPSPPIPLISEHWLWCFAMPKPPTLVDLEDPAAIAAYHHRLFDLLNPTSEDYHTTAMVGDLVRQPNPHSPAIGGILAPSVRTPALHGYVPRQHVFFVPHNALGVAAKQIRRWRLTVEFRDNVGIGVTAQTRDIDWTRPWFRLQGANIPHPFVAGAWNQIAIKYV